jgi:hypothetical protein
LDSKLKPKGGRLTILGMISQKMNLIIINLMLMPHKFGANASNLVLMPKKTSNEGHYNFIFFLNYVLHKTERTLEELTRRTPIIFLFKEYTKYLFLFKETGKILKLH